MLHVHVSWKTEYKAIYCRITNGCMIFWTLSWSGFVFRESVTWVCLYCWIFTSLIKLNHILYINFQSLVKNLLFSSWRGQHEKTRFPVSSDILILESQSWEFLRNQENSCENMVSSWYSSCGNQTATKVSVPQWESDDIDIGQINCLPVWGPSLRKWGKDHKDVCTFPLPLLVFFEFSQNRLIYLCQNIDLIRKHDSFSVPTMFCCITQTCPNSFKEVCVQMVLYHGNRHQIHSLQLPLLPPCLCFWHITWISLLSFWRTPGKTDNKSNQLERREGYSSKRVTLALAYFLSFFICVLGLPWQAGLLFPLLTLQVRLTCLPRLTFYLFPDPFTVTAH